MTNSENTRPSAKAGITSLLVLLLVYSIGAVAILAPIGVFIVAVAWALKKIFVG